MLLPGVEIIDPRALLATIHADLATVTDTRAARAIVDRLERAA